MPTTFEISTLRILGTMALLIQLFNSVFFNNNLDLFTIFLLLYVPIHSRSQMCMLEKRQLDYNLLLLTPFLTV